MLRRCFRRCATKFEEQYASTGSGITGGEPRPLTALHVGILRQEPGALLKILTPFYEHGLNLTYVQSRELPLQSKAEISSVFLHVPATTDDTRVKECLKRLHALDLPICNVLGSWNIPWFPTNAADLDKLNQETMAAGADLMDDPENPHPGFRDQEYRDRRKVIVENAAHYKYGQPIPRVDYNASENATWAAIWDKLTALYPTHACSNFRRVFPLLVENAGYRRNNIPQLEDVSNFLQEQTGFTVRPVAGLLSSRDFFNALAFKVFFSTQYIRHHSMPLYTPEPDVCHELFGHAPLFADPDFAAFSQEIGLLSLGASDADIERLSRCYWYTVEFGLAKESGGVRAYGAGLLSSFGELEHALSGKPKLLPWDPFVASELEFPITKYQPTYFVAETFKDAQKKLREFGDTLDRPFRVEHVAATNSVRTWAINTF